ncbi:MAG: hypothetical protein Salg2KO_04490 [Salibacteraceae bacterium]
MQMNHYSSQSDKVLVVDDEMDVCFLLKSILSAAGKEVEVCNTLAQCEKKIRTFQPKYLILDVNLPDGNGLDRMEQLKSVDPSLNIIVHSAINTPQNIQIAEQKGAQAFISKPLNRHELLECLDQ